MSGLDIADLYQRYAPVLYRRCLLLLGNHADAEDALQEVFIAAQRGAGSFRGQASPLTWLYRICTNHCLNTLRGRARRHAASERHGQHLCDHPPAAALSAEDAALVRQLLPQLDEQTAQAAVLYFVDGLNQDEAATALGISAPTLRRRLESFIERARRRAS